MLNCKAVLSRSPIKNLLKLLFLKQKQNLFTMIFFFKVKGCVWGMNFCLVCVEIQNSHKNSDVYFSKCRSEEQVGVCHLLEDSLESSSVTRTWNDNKLNSRLQKHLKDYPLYQWNVT